MSYNTRIYKVDVWDFTDTNHIQSRVLGYYDSLEISVNTIKKYADQYRVDVDKDLKQLIDETMFEIIHHFTVYEISLNHYVETQYIERKWSFDKNGNILAYSPVSEIELYNPNRLDFDPNSTIEDNERNGYFVGRSSKDINFSIGDEVYFVQSFNVNCENEIIRGIVTDTPLVLNYPLQNYGDYTDDCYRVEYKLDDGQTEHEHPDSGEIFKIK